MSAAIPPLPPETEAAPTGLSEGQRIINTFVSPSRTFEDLRRNASWWVPWLLGSIMSTAFFFVVDKKIGFEAIASNQMANAPAFAQRAMEQLTPEQRSQSIQRQALGTRIGTLYFSWLASLIWAVILAALLMFAFNFMLEAGIPFKNALATVFYGSLPRLIFLGLGIVVLLIGVDPAAFDLENPVATNLGAFLDPATSGKFLYRLSSGLDIFAVWTVILLGMGFAKQSKKKISTGTAVTTIAILYGIYVLGRAGLAAL
jgi:hypothetical protein